MIRSLPLSWRVAPHDRRDADPEQWIPASVPGAVQLDWAASQGWPPYWEGENARRYDGLEDRHWTYASVLDFPAPRAGERLFFVCGGVDYACEVVLNGKILHRQEGLQRKIELELTGQVQPGDKLLIVVLPAPKSRAAPADRSQANASCKPAVSYGWDFHPRLIPLGIWQEAALEIRPPSFLGSVTIDQNLSADHSFAELFLGVAIDGDREGLTLAWSVRDPAGKSVAEMKQSLGGRGSGTAASAPPSLSARIERPDLWWPNGHGTPALYVSTVELIAPDGATLDRRTQRVGLRSTRLIMAPGQWSLPADFPKSRTLPPMTLEVNGRALFAKGANWVSPEIFPGRLGEQTYRPLLEAARAAHFNLLRMWGGAPAQKDSFYDLCDELGLMVWQEFPLACNEYPDAPGYLRALDADSRALIARLKPHACLALWCGGNELFNAWSGMTDQSLPLRLLARNCFELDPSRPFLPTSPVDGVGHGHYVFRDPRTGDEAWKLFQEARCTAYTEFGIPGPASIEVLREIIPAAELFPPRAAGSWAMHHGFGAWLPMSHLSLEVIEHYFGATGSLEALVERGQLLQAEGLKGLYEEARRQKPAASMALCWCLNEPWPSAANNSLLSWPARPKPALAAVGEACRPLLASARLRKFAWREGELFEAELWWLNDLPAAVTPGLMVASLATDRGESHARLEWNAGPLAAGANLAGPTLRWRLPPLECDRFWLVLSTPSAAQAGSRYLLLYRRGAALQAPEILLPNLG